MNRGQHDPAPAIASTLRFYRDTLAWLAGYHSAIARTSM
jgi:hypothetical protein